MTGQLSGAVLTGGQSRRMGTDKALLPVDGVPMARRVASAMAAAGLTEVVAIGGDGPGLAALGLTVVPDRHPGEGPLGGILTALTVTTSPWVVVTACDMPWIGVDEVTALIDVVDDDLDAVVSTAAGELQPLHAAWRVTALAPLTAAFDQGERAPRRAIERLRHRTVELGPGDWATDLDEPPA